MEQENPGQGPKLIDLVVQKDKDEDLKHEVQKQEEVKNLNANLAENGKEAPRPPMYHHISAKMAEIMGKREWERAAVGESDKFFRLYWMEEESSSFLANRKEIWVRRITVLLGKNTENFTPPVLTKARIFLHLCPD